MSFKIVYKPRGQGIQSDWREASAKTAVEALSIAEALVASDEEVRISSSDEGGIDMHFLRVLAREEQPN